MRTGVQLCDSSFLFEHQPEAWLRRSGGRETFLWHGGPGLDCVVKRTQKDVVGERWHEWIAMGATGAKGRTGRFGRARSPGRREHDNLVRLAEAGFPVPRAITWCEERSGWLGAVARSLVVMERVPHEETLRERLARAGGTVHAGERRALLAQLAELVARFHASGWYHRDLYLQHVVLREDDGTLVLIDLGRARRTRAGRRPRRRWLVKDLAAVLHSCPASVTQRERLAFIARWLDRAPIEGRAARRRWLAAIERKRARLAAHVPRDERVLAKAP